MKRRTKTGAVGPRDFLLAMGRRQSVDLRCVLNVGIRIDNLFEVKMEVFKAKKGGNVVKTMPFLPSPKSPPL